MDEHDDDEDDDNRPELSSAVPPRKRVHCSSACSSMCSKSLVSFLRNDSCRLGMAGLVFFFVRKLESATSLREVPGLEESSNRLRRLRLGEDANVSMRSMEDDNRSGAVLVSAETATEVLPAVGMAESTDEWRLRLGAAR